MDKLLISLCFGLKSYKITENVILYTKCQSDDKQIIKEIEKLGLLTHLTISGQLRMAQMQFPEEIIRKQIPNKNPVSKVNILQRWLLSHKFTINNFDAHQKPRWFLQSLFSRWHYGMAYLSFLCIRHVLAAVKFNYFIFCGAAIILSAMFLGKFVSVSKFCAARAKQFETFLTYM